MRESSPDVMVPLFAEGRCYQFFLILRKIYPEAEAWYDYCEGHVYTKIGKYWYDINGIHRKLNKYCSPLDHFQGHRPHRWAKADKRVLTKG